MTMIMMMECDDDVYDHDDWVAFTFGEALRALRAHPPCAHAYTLVANMACSVVRKQADLSSQGYHLYDWHIENIAFHDTAPAQVLLIDWQDNSASDGPVFKRNMTRAFQAFTKYLQEPEDQLGGSAWVMFMQNLQGALNSWFSPLHQLPTKEDPRSRPQPPRTKLESPKPVSNKNNNCVARTSMLWSRLVEISLRTV